MEVGFQEREATVMISIIWMINPSDKTNNIIQELIIEAQKEKIKIPLNVIFKSLGIEAAGENVGNILSKLYTTFEQVRNLKTEELESVENIGPICAKNICEYFKNNEEKINNLLKFIEVINVKKEENLDSKINNKSFVLSGKIESVNGEGKAYFQNLIEEQGGIIKSGVSSKIDFLIYGNGSGLKSEKAKALGVTILTGDELEELLGI